MDAQCSRHAVLMVQFQHTDTGAQVTAQRSDIKLEGLSRIDKKLVEAILSAMFLRPVLNSRYVQCHYGVML